MNPLTAAAAITALGSAACAQQSLTTTSLRLPEAVRVRAVGHRNNEAMFFDQWQVVESPRGVWAQQDWFEGGAGFVPITLTISNDSETFLYDIRSRRGNRGDRYAQSGTTRIDGLATPLAWVRYAAHASERGDTITQTPAEPGRIVLTLTAPPMSGRSFECTINTGTSELEEVRRGDGGYVRYTDWRDIGGGLHMPFAIDLYTPAMGQVPPLTRRYQVDSAEPVDARAPLPTFPLPPDAVIVDDRTGEVTNGLGQRLNVEASALPPAPVPMASPSPAVTAQTRLLAASPQPAPTASSPLTTDRVVLGLGAGLAATGLILYAVRSRTGRGGARGTPRSQAR